MFRFLCRNQIHRIRDLFLIRYSSHPIYFCSAFSTDSNNSFTVSYLINSCQLSPEKAVCASKKVQFKTSAKPDSVLTLLRNYRFTDTHISQLIEKSPSVLVSKADTTLKPRLDYFQSLGFSGDELGKLISSSPFIFRSSLERQIKPNISFLRSIVEVDDKFMLMLKRSTVFLATNQLKYLEPNISLLRCIGVPESNIRALLVVWLRMFLKDVNKFKVKVEQVKKMGFDPSKFTFCQALNAFLSMSNSTKKEKFDSYKAWGWSDQMIYRAIRREPTYITLSKKMIMIKMEFLVKKMGFNSLLIAKYPAVLKYSMERRIIPRCSVLQLMISSGVIKRPTCLYSIFRIPDEKFLKSYVTKYEKKLPQLLDVYQGKMTASQPSASGV